MLKYKLNRRMPNGTYGGVRGEKFTKNYPLLDYKRKIYIIISKTFQNHFIVFRNNKYIIVV